MRLLDLFCGAGGASMGYHQAGFDEIIGVDIEPQPNYPFEFVQADATQPPFDLADFDLIHASPPCQHFTRYKNVHKDIDERYGDHLAETQSLLADYPYVIENVPGAPMRPDVVLCGSMFGLDVMRHRWFETSFPVLSPACNHKGWKRRFKPSSDRPNKRYTIEIGAWNEPLELQKQCMGVYWDITLRELSEAIPPAYTRHLGEQFINQRATL